MIGTLTLNFQVLTPLLVRKQLHGEATLFGLLLGVMGAGPIAAGLLPRLKRRPNPQPRTLVNDTRPSTNSPACRDAQYLASPTQPTNRVA